MPRWSTNNEIHVNNNAKKSHVVGTKSRLCSMNLVNGTKYEKYWRRYLDLSLRNESARENVSFLMLMCHMTAHTNIFCILHNACLYLYKSNMQ